ncbi:MAG: ATP-binding protein [Clostridiales bacterium]|nr:ATP-binding protein [Clostridiales bacterium]
MLNRKVLNDLLSWKQRKHHPLIVEGLRQIGKTFSVMEFGRTNYKSVVYIDLRKNKTMHQVFENDFDVDDMVLSITALDTTVRFIPGETLVVLDEIQDCPNARSSLKYWDMDGRYDVIATGSFLGVKGFRNVFKRGIPVGYEERYTMHQLSFFEFLENVGVSPEVMNRVEQSLSTRKTVPSALHESLRKHYLLYLIVGGMPEAVNCFIETHDLNQIRQVQRMILSSIRDDFGRYIDANGEDRINEVLKLRAEACLDSIPSQLAKEYKKFQYSLVDVRGKSPEKADGLQYLLDVGLVCKANNIREISAPLEGNKIIDEFKVYVCDTGLLMSMLEEGTAAHVLRGDMSAYKGAVAENMVASAFVSSDRKLYYFHAPSGSPELDFIFQLNGDATILECKSTNNRVTSMKYVLKNPKKYGEHPAIKLADTNVGEGEGFVTFPLYAMEFLLKLSNETESALVEFDLDSM